MIFLVSGVAMLFITLNVWICNESHKTNLTDPTVCADNVCISEIGKILICGLHNILLNESNPSKVRGVRNS